MPSVRCRRAPVQIRRARRGDLLPAEIGRRPLPSRHFRQATRSGRAGLMDRPGTRCGDVGSALSVSCWTPLAARLSNSTSEGTRSTRREPVAARAATDSRRAAIRQRAPAALLQDRAARPLAAVADRGSVHGNQAARSPLAHLAGLPDMRDRCSPGGGRTISVLQCGVLEQGIPRAAALLAALFLERRWPLRLRDRPYRHISPPGR